MPSIYLDYAAATPLDPRVLKAMLPFLKTEFANPSSIHAPGMRARQAVENARAEVAELIGARSSEIVFTSGATESINLAILGAARAYAASGRHIVSVATEHKAALRALELEGFEVTLVPVDARGQVGAEAVLAAVRPDTILVSVMFANNEIGTIAPIAEIGRGLLRLRKSGQSLPLFHTDAAQANGVVALDVQKLHVDLMTLSAAKMYGPKGAGALFVKSGIKLRQVMAGGNHEFGLRPGTENVPAIVGFGIAAQIAKTELADNERHLWAVREAFLETLHKHTKDLQVNGDPESTVPHIVNVTFPGVDGEALVIHLDAEGISCSTAAACKSSDFPSHVLRAIGFNDAMIRATIRLSFGRMTSLAQAKAAARRVAKTVDRLRA